MKLHRHALLLLLALILTACARTAVVDPEKYDHLVVVGTNDFHGYLRTSSFPLGEENVLVGGAEWFAGYVRILEKKYGDRFLLLDGGDIFQGTIESNLFLGRSTLDFYNLLPYRAAAVGNHEFDYGPVSKNDPDRLGAIKMLMKNAKFPFVQANIFRFGKPWKETNLFPSVIVHAGGYKVGILGLTTEHTPAQTSVANLKGMTFASITEMALAEANNLRARGAEIVLVAAHEGGSEPHEPIPAMLAKLPAGTVDAVVAGHSHKEVAKFMSGVPVIQSKTRGQYFGRIDLFVDKTTRKIVPDLTRIQPMHEVCGTWFKSSESCDLAPVKADVALGKVTLTEYIPLRAAKYEGEEVKPDLRVRETLEPYFGKVNVLKREVLAKTQKDFQTYPSGETDVGALFTAAFRWKIPRAQVVYLNGGGLRRPLLEGNVTYGDLYEVSPFDNQVVLVTMTGAQLKDLIRRGVSGTVMIPAVSGVKVSYRNADLPEFQRDVNGDGKKEPWEMDRDVRVTWDDGRPLNDSELVRVATIEYLLAGGENTQHIFGKIPQSRIKHLDVIMRDLAAEYLRAFPGITLPLKAKLSIEARP